MQLFPINGLSALTLMADHDRPKNGQADGAGQLAAQQCRRRWRSANTYQEIDIHIPEVPGDDWADAWERHCRE